MVFAIVFESTDMMSSANTGSFLLPLLHKLLPRISTHQLEAIHDILRKMGHVFGYAILSSLMFRSWWGTAAQHARTWQSRFAFFGWSAATAVAIADELHQMTIPSRGGSVHDMVLDSCAAIAAQLIIYYFLRDHALTAKTSSA